MMCLKPVVAAALFGSALLLPSVAYAEIKDRTLKFAFTAGREHPQGLGVQKFADLVKEKSGGKIQVRLFPEGALGGDLQTISALQGGTLDLTVLNAGLLAGNVKEFAILDLPFLFNNPEEADAVVDGSVGQKLFAKLPEKGLVGLTYWELGFRNVTTSRRPITKLEDFQGLKLRVVQAPLFIDLFNALGANAVPLAFPELYTALEQKVVDGQENPLATIEATKFNDVQTYLSITRHIYNPQAVLISKRTWDGFSEEEKKIINEAANESRSYQRQVSREKNAQSIENLVKAGMKVNEVPPQELERIREKIKPITDKYSAQAGDALLSEINAEIAKKR
ncbi:TRAP transporter substrate-binding protein [Microvirga aerophila]|uniref:ABC transporter substrate-binding protein n=1 Tax=Microvirga aerophila TaxID=670291 RepID=A0A512C1P6_9HYPH|nr:TRAP transporter substrate-binding protein [Microvirga aerophila]GEO18142.1 ABC transporter substrate-binding protein [Microvirga aerophila]